MKVTEAIDRIQKILDYMESLDADEEELKDIEALRMTIRSLEAWDKVIEEIDGIEIERNASWYVFYQKTLEIINKHLKEVSGNE